MKKEELERLFKELDKIESHLANGKIRTNELLRYMQIKKELLNLGVKHFPLSKEERRRLLEKMD